MCPCSIPIRRYSMQPRNFPWSFEHCVRVTLTMTLAALQCNFKDPFLSVREAFCLECTAPNRVPQTLALSAVSRDGVQQGI